MTPITTLNESLADPRDMFAAHTMFRREFGLMPDEEERVVPLIVKHITDAEYAVLAQEHAAHIPPGKLPAVLGMIM